MEVPSTRLVRTQYRLLVSTEYVDLQCEKHPIFSFSCSLHLPCPAAQPEAFLGIWKMCSLPSRSLQWDPASWSRSRPILVFVQVPKVGPNSNPPNFSFNQVDRSTTGRSGGSLQIRTLEVCSGTRIRPYRARLLNLGPVSDLLGLLQVPGYEYYSI